MYDNSTQNTLPWDSDFLSKLINQPADNAWLDKLMGNTQNKQNESTNK